MNNLKMKSHYINTLLALGMALGAQASAGTLLMNEASGNTNLAEVKGSDYETIVVQSDSTIGKVTSDPAVNFINVFS